MDTTVVRKNQERAAPAGAPCIRVFPLPPTPSPVAGFVRLAARVEGCPEGPGELWYDVEAAHAPHAFPDLADAYALALLFPAMRHGLDLCVEGRVSADLLENLEWLNEAWASWRPGRYRRVRIDAKEPCLPTRLAGRGAVILFSGGVDSCHALLRHKRGLLGKRTREIAKAVLVHGADFGVADDARARAATERAGRMTGDLGVPLCVVRSNFRAFGDNWEDSHGCCLASCLHWFALEAGCGVIGSTIAFPNLHSVWGTHPATDPLLGCGGFAVTYDSLSHARVDKAALVASWPQAMADLRVCYSNGRDELNCGRCRKCLFTSLAFMACGAKAPTLRTDLSARDVLALWRMPAWSGNEVVPILAAARRSGQGRTRVFAALRLVLWFNARVYHGLLRRP